MPKFLKGRQNAVGASVLSVLLLTTSVVIAVRTDGYRATKVRLNDASVWISGENISALKDSEDGGDAAVGRVNTEISEINATVPTGGAVDLFQDGNMAMYHSGPAVLSIDASTLEVTNGALPPEDVSMAVGGGTVAVIARDGRVWVRPSGEPVDLGENAVETTQVDADSLLVVDSSGRAITYRPGEDKGFAIARDGDKRSWSIERTGTVDGSHSSDAATKVSPVQLSAVGRTPVVLDVNERKLSVSGGPSVTIEQGLGEIALQQPSPSASTVAFASGNDLNTVDLDSGTQNVLKPPEQMNSGAGGGGVPVGSTGVVRPVVAQGCVYGAWQSNDPWLARVCPNTPRADVSSSVQGWSGGTSVFRVNHERVVLNSVADGGGFLVDKDNVVKAVKGWETAKKIKPEEMTDQGNIKNPDPLRDCKDSQGTKTDAVDYQLDARVGIPRVISLGDIPGLQAPRCGVLKFSKKFDVQGEAEVEWVAPGEAIQVTAATAGTIQINYTVDDGGSASQADSATLSITVHENSAVDDQPPVLERPNEARQATLAVAGQAMIYNPLLKASDPEGDAIAVIDACVGEASCLDTAPPRPTSQGTVQFRSDGPIHFSPPLGVTGRTMVSFKVTDSWGKEAKGSVDVQVQSAEEAVPVSHEDRIEVVRGTRANLDLLGNDVSPSGRPLVLMANEVVSTTSGNADTVSSQLKVASDGASLDISDQLAVGSTLIKYKVSDNGPGVGGQGVDGVARIDVVEPQDASPPVAVRDDISATAGHTTSIDVLKNDFDPGGRVMAIRSVSIVSGAEAGDLKLQVDTDMATIKVTPPANFDDTERAPLVVRYVVSNGTLDSMGTLVVSPYRGRTPMTPIVANDGPFTVQAGGAIRIPVLVNDVDPLGAPLRVESVEQLPPEQGIAITQGDEVTFVAPRDSVGGMAVFSYTATNAPMGTSDGATGTADVTVRIMPADGDGSAPDSLNLTARAMQGGKSVLIKVPLLAADADGDVVGIAGITEAPSHGDVEVQGEGFLYTADLDLDDRGTDTFSFNLTDGVHYSRSTVRVAVVPGPDNSDLMAVPIELVVKPGRSTTIDLLNPRFVTSSAGNLTVPLTGGQKPQTDNVFGELGTIAADGTVDYKAPDEIGGDGRTRSTSFTYWILDSAGGAKPNVVNIRIDPNAPDLDPIALDDFVLPQRSGSQVSAAILANDIDTISGSSKTLKVELVDQDGVTPSIGEGGIVSFTMPDRSVRLRYKVTGVNDRSAEAVVNIPLNVGVACQNDTVTAQQKSDVVLDVLSRCEGPPNQELHIITSSLVVDSALDASDVNVDGGSIRLHVGSPQAGDYSVKSAVCVESACSDTTVTVSDKITIEGENSPPNLEKVSVEVPADGQAHKDLKPFVRDENPGDAARVKFSGDVKIESSTGGITAELTEQGMLTVFAAPDAYKKGEGNATLTVSFDDGHKENARNNGTVDVEVVPTTKGPVLAVADNESIIQVDGGKAFKFKVLDNDQNPTTAGRKALELASVTQPTAANSGQVTITDGGQSVDYTPHPDFGGTTTFTYVVQDSDDPARQSTGLVTVKVIGFPGQPGTPQPTPVQQNAEVIRLQWAAADGNGGSVDGYEIQCQVAGGGSCPTGSKKVQGSATRLEFDRLEGNVGYQFRVRAHNEAGDGKKPNEGWSEWSTTTFTVPPPPVITKIGNFLGTCSASASDSITCANGSDDGTGTRLTVRWNRVPKDQSDIQYVVRVTGASMPSREVSAGTNDSVAVEGLLPGQRYSFTVRASNESGQSAESNPMTGTAARPPRPVEALNFTPGDANANSGQGDATVTWSPPINSAQTPGDGGSPITRYQARWTCSNCSPTSGAASTNDGSATSISLLNLENGATYQVTVTAINAAGTGTPSTRTGTPAGKPDSITGGQARPGSASGAIDLAFNQQNTRGAPISKYIVRGGNFSERQITSFIPSNISVLAGGSTSVTLSISSLQNGTTYGPFEVRACNNSHPDVDDPVLECSGWTPITNSPIGNGTVIPFGPPQLSGATRVSNTSASWTWPVVSGATYTATCSDGGTANVSSGRVTCEWGNGPARSVSVTVTAASQGLSKSSSGNWITVSTQRITSSPGDMATGYKTVTGTDCINCYYVNVTATGLKPNTNYVFVYETNLYVNDTSGQWYVSDNFSCMSRCDDRFRDTIRSDAGGNAQIVNGSVTVGVGVGRTGANRGNNVYSFAVGSAAKEGGGPVVRGCGLARLDPSGGSATVTDNCP